jgi:hypothetical protein
VLSLPPLCARSNHLRDDADCFSPLPTNSTFVDKSKHGSSTTDIFESAYILHVNILGRLLASLAEYRVDDDDDDVETRSNQ